MSDRSFASVVSSLTFAAMLVLLLPLLGQTQDTAAQPPGAGSRTPPFKPEELEQIVAPIALYQDSLLAQIFMASTYPLEVVEAARWSKDNPDVKGDAVADAVKDQTWDPSVKSLCAFPQVLTMMNEKLDWTQKLGDAFLAQQADVMQAVQRLRNKAMETGNLKSSKEVTVKTEPAPPPAEGAAAVPGAPAPPPQTIIIESPDPEVIYVPTYNPTVVYGAWAYPSYPPYYYYPPGYAAGAAFWSFTAGVVVGGALWGNCNWGGNDVDIDINRENNFTRNTNRETNRTNNKWEHNSEHRKGVGYRDSGTQQKYGRGNSQGTQAREQYRGRADQGREQIAREGAGNQRDLAGNQVGSRDAGAAQNRDVSGGQNRDLGGAGNRGTTPQAGDRGTAQSRDAGRAQSRDAGSAQSRSTGASQSRNTGSSSASRSSASRSSSGAFSGAGSGASTRSSASRGNASRSSAGMRGGGGRRR